MLKNIIGAERDQDADCARINAAIRLAEQEFAALDGRHLDPDEARRKWTVIRDRTVLAIRDVRRNIARRAREASETRDQLIEKFLREAADSVDEGTAQEFPAMPQDISTRRLLDHLCYLVRTGELSRMRSGRVALEEGNDRHRYASAFEEISAQLASAGPSDDLERLARICRLAEELDSKITELFCTHSMGEGSRDPTPEHLAPSLERVPVSLMHDGAASSVRSPPPCGEGLGVRVVQ